MIADPKIRRRMAGCVALMESPEKGEADAAKAMLAKLESKYGPYIPESKISRGSRTASDFGDWAHKWTGVDPAGEYPTPPSDAKGIQPWQDADMADLASECARWLWLSGWYCQMEWDRWNICPDHSVGDWIKHGISNAELIQFAHQKGFGMVQLGEAADRIGQFRQAIDAPQFDVDQAKPGMRAPRKNFDPKKAPNKKGFVD